MSEKVIIPESMVNQILAILILFTLFMIFFTPNDGWAIRFGFLAKLIQPFRMENMIRETKNRIN